MALPIIGADERLKQRGVRIQIYGGPKIGKTSLILTLPAETTLVLDSEAGLLSIGDYPVDSVPVKGWEEAQDLACWIGGPNPAMRPDQCYSSRHFDRVTARYGDRSALSKYETVFIDSTTFLASQCLQWAQGQPEGMNAQGRPDMRGSYGLLGRELVAWAWQWHHAPIRNVILVGGLDQREDDFGRKTWVPLIDGSKGATTLPYVFDEILTLGELRTDDGTPYRALICRKLNPWGYPAGDRSGRLDLIEEPHLGKLLAKIAGPKRVTGEPPSHDLPQATEAAEAAE